MKHTSNIKTAPKSTETRVKELEREIHKLNKFYKKCQYKDIIEKYNTLNSTLLTMIGIVLTVVTICIAIPTIYNVITYNTKMSELDKMMHSQKYMTLAEHASSDEKKIEYYTAAIEYDKENPELYFLRASAYYCIGNNDMAIKDCITALKYNENYEDAHFMCGTIYFETERYDLAINEFLQVFSIYDESEINAYIAYSYFQLNEFENALYYFQKTTFNAVKYVVYDTSEENIFILSSICHLELGNYNEAASEVIDFLNSRCDELDEYTLAANQLIRIYASKNDTSAIDRLNTLLNNIHSEYNERYFELQVFDENKIFSMLNNGKTLKNELYRYAFALIE